MAVPVLYYGVSQRICCDCYQVKCVVETRDQEHCNQLEKLLRSNYNGVNFGPNII